MLPFLFKVTTTSSAPLLRPVAKKFQLKDVPTKAILKEEIISQILTEEVAHNSQNV